MQHLFLDCSHGMSGDMTLASLAHLGVDLSPLPGLLAQAGVACRLEVWQEERGGGPGCRVEVSWEAEGQPLRHPADIAAIFAAVPVSDRVRHKALAVLEALTLAEAEAHGIAPEEVHFHEVGAVDTLVDILGACWALDQLGVERVTACALPWFGGSITCAHGEIPLPAPATANLMRGLPVHPTDAKTELVTPTGAALARVLVDEFVDGPAGRLLALGTGMVEVFGTFLGYFAVSVSQAILPFALAFAGGTMLYVISDEMIPETHADGHERLATYSLLTGVCVMLITDTLMG